MTITANLALLSKEVRDVLTSRALWIMLWIQSFLVGYSFIQAVDLYSQASRTALEFPELAKGFTPLDGIFVPTFGALYLVTTLLFPFVVIRLISAEKQSGSLKLLLQLPMPLGQVMVIKLLALVVAWILVLAPCLSAVVFWVGLGGHVYYLELLNLLLGYTLYGLAIVGIASWAAAMTDSAATAAIVALAFTLGSWVLDFAAGNQSGLRQLSWLSLTVPLRGFEQGLFSSPHVLQMVGLAIALLVLSTVWLPPGKHLIRKLQQSGAIVLVASLLIGGLIQFPAVVDLTENQRNSFNPAQERALRQLDKPLQVTLYLSPEDSRLKEMERNVLAKLRRSVPHLHVIYAQVDQGGLFNTTPDLRYGLIEYEYDGSRAQSRSNSANEILPLLYKLSGQTVTLDPMPVFPGYPLVANAKPAQVWFYGILPALIGMGWWLTQSSPQGWASILLAPLTFAKRFIKDHIRR